MPHPKALVANYFELMLWSLPRFDESSMTNQLYYGDNLGILRASIPTESVDLIYLDPPFNSSANYNVLFRDKSGHQSQAQIEAFEDTWEWGPEAVKAYEEVLRSSFTDAARLLSSMKDFLGQNDLMAYLCMMAVRILELHRVLKPTGSIYLHCDPTASHYLKLLMDAVFRPERFLNEVTWKRTTAHNDPKRYGRVQDRLLFYSKSAQKTFNHVRGTYSPEQLTRYKYEDEAGSFRAENLTAPHFSVTRTVEWRGVHPGANRQWRFGVDELERLYADGRILLQQDGRPRKDGLKEYLHEAEGPAMQDVWTDIALAPTAGERLGYPTQKPVALLERIIAASSNEGDVVLDPFLGGGTTAFAAQKLKRKWIGIDVTYLAIGMVQKRLREGFPGIKFDISGQPEDLHDAAVLFKADPYQFQWWAVSLIDARPHKGQRKGADQGIDGLMFVYSSKTKTDKVVVSVKGGGTGVKDVRDLVGVLDREKSPMGIFITLQHPSGPMLKEAASAGSFKCDFGSYPRVQVFTIEELLSGKQPRLPPQNADATIKRTAKEDTSEQRRLGL